MKKFCSTDKWDDGWFCGLSQTHMLAWSLLNDRCDHAGVFEMAEMLCRVHLKDPTFTVEEFAAVAGPERLLRLPCGKWWLPKYISFQHGRLSKSKNQHQPVFRSIAKHSLPVDDSGLPLRQLSDSYSTAIQQQPDSYRIAIRQQSGGGLGDGEGKNLLLVENQPASTASTTLSDSYPIGIRQLSDRDQVVVEDKVNSSSHAHASAPARASELRIEPTTDELNLDPWAGMPVSRDGMLEIARMATASLNGFSPEAVVDAYAVDRQGCDFHTFGKTDYARPLSVQNIRGDFTRFMRHATAHPEAFGLISRSSAASESHPDEPAGWRDNFDFLAFRDKKWKSLHPIDRQKVLDWANEQPEEL